ncbi:MAG: response regulator [Deltaproteobacteria bacterium]|nr:response regulator [Deltaproteobacteria bacterium]
MNEATPSDGKWILLVEDDADNREVLCEVLRSEGFAVTEAVHGADALARIRGADGPPGLVLLDLMMPVMNGWQFLAELRGDRALSSTPVVLLTAGRDVDARAIDANDLVRKPVHLPDLLAKVERWLR